MIKNIEKYAKILKNTRNFQKNHEKITINSQNSQKNHSTLVIFETSEMIDF